jgi:hypothetical protein
MYATSAHGTDLNLVRSTYCCNAEYLCCAVLCLQGHAELREHVSDTSVIDACTCTICSLALL